MALRRSSGTYRCPDLKSWSSGGNSFLIKARLSLCQKKIKSINTTQLVSEGVRIHTKIKKMTRTVRHYLSAETPFLDILSILSPYLLCTLCLSFELLPWIRTTFKSVKWQNTPEKNCVILSTVSDRSSSFYLILIFFCDWIKIFLILTEIYTRNYFFHFSPFLTGVPICHLITMFSKLLKFSNIYNGYNTWEIH